MIPRSTARSWILLSWVACGRQDPPPPAPLFESLSLHIGEEAHFEHVSASAELEELATGLAVGGAGHRSSGRWVLRWDDGETIVFDGATGLGGCSRGYDFNLDGMDGFGSVAVKGYGCPRP